MRDYQQPPAPRAGRRLGAILAPIGGILVTVAVLTGSYQYARSGIPAISATTPTIPFPVTGATTPAAGATRPPGSPRPNDPYASTDVPHAIPDNSRTGVLSHLTVADHVVIGSVRLVNLRVSHPDTGELNVKLLAPDLTLVPLLTLTCPGSRSWAALTLDDQAPVPAGTACADNFSGSRRPQPDGALGAFRGLDAQGDWVLGVSDIHAGNVGTLEGWGLQFTAADAAVLTPGAASTPSATPPPAGSPTATGFPASLPAAPSPGAPAPSPTASATPAGSPRPQPSAGP